MKFGENEFLIIPNEAYRSASFDKIQGYKGQKWPCLEATIESKVQCLVFGCISTHEKETFNKGDLSDIFFSLVGAVCRAAIARLQAIFCSSLKILKSQISTTYMCVLNYGLEI